MNGLRTLAVAAPLVALAAASVAYAQGGAKITPGQWETTTEIVDMKMQGLPDNVPPEMLARFKPKPITVKTCVTPEQAANPKAEMMAAQKDNQCTVARFDMSGGKIDIAMSCADKKQRGKADISMKGSYTPASYTMNGAMKMNGEEGMSMNMTTRTTGKRLGACPG